MKRPTESRLGRLRATLLNAVLHSAAHGLGLTLRIRTRGEAAVAEYRGLGPGPLLFALWHGDFFPIYFYCRGSGCCVIVSRSGDGEVLARLLHGSGYHTVRGSTSRGGTRATVDLAREVRAGRDAAVAIDGPRGPRHTAKPGIVLLAKMTGCPIVPLATATSRGYQFSSWDRFMLPYPFQRVVLAAGAPIVVGPDATTEVIEQKRLELEEATLALRRDAQSMVAKGRFSLADHPLRGTGATAAVPS